MWRLRGRCPRCGNLMLTHPLAWLQSVAWRALGRKRDEGVRVALVKKALEFYDTHDIPVRVEPAFRSESRHATGNILTRSQLVQAFYDALDVSPWVVLRTESAGSGRSSVSGESSAER